MSLEDVFYSEGTETYYMSLPYDVRQQLLNHSSQIKSSNDLYRYGEEFLSRKNIKNKTS